MVMIPNYESQVGVQRSDSGPAPRRRSVAEVTQVAKATERLAGQIGRTAMVLGEVAKRERENEVLTTVESAQDEWREKMLGEEGFMRRQGEATSGLTEAGQEAFDELESRYATGLSGAQKRIYDRHMRDFRGGQLNQLARHQLKEQTAYQQKRLASSTEVARENAILDHNSPASYDAAMDKIRANVGQQVALQGFVPGTKDYKTAFEAALLVEERKLATAVAGRFMAGDDPHTAKVFLVSPYAEAIDPVQREKMLQNVDKLGAAKRVEKETDYLFGTSQKEGRTLNEAREAALKRARSRNEGEREEQVVAAINRRFDEAERIDFQKHKDTYSTLLGEMLALDGQVDAYEKAKRMAMQHEDPEFQLQLLGIAERLKTPKSERKPASKAESHMALGGMMWLADSELLEGMSQEEKEVFIYEQAVHQNMREADIEKAVNYLRDGGIAGKWTRSELDGMVKLYTDGKKGLQDFDGLLPHLYEQIRRGRIETDEQLGEIVGYWLTDGWLNDAGVTFNDTDITRYEAYAAGRGDEFYTDISSLLPEQRKEIAASLKERKKNRSSDNMALEAEQLGRVAYQSELMRQRGMPILPHGMSKELKRIWEAKYGALEGKDAKGKK